MTNFTNFACAFVLSQFDMASECTCNICYDYMVKRIVYNQMRVKWKTEQRRRHTIDWRFFFACRAKKYLVKVTIYSDWHSIFSRLNVAKKVHVYQLQTLRNLFPRENCIFRYESSVRIFFMHFDHLTAYNLTHIIIKVCIPVSMS